MPYQTGDDIVDELRHIRLFARLSNAALDQIAALGEPVDAEPGAVLMDQGDVGTECFLILEGEASVRAGGEHVATVGAGTIVGEMALIGHRPRSATVVADSPMRLRAFDIAAFRTVLESLPEAREFVLEVLEERAAANRSDS